MHTIKNENDMEKKNKNKKKSFFSVFISAIVCCSTFVFFSACVFCRTNLISVYSPKYEDTIGYIDYFFFSFALKIFTYIFHVDKNEKKKVDTLQLYVHII